MRAVGPELLAVTSLRWHYPDQVRRVCGIATLSAKRSPSKVCKSDRIIAPGGSRRYRPREEAGRPLAAARRTYYVGTVVLPQRDSAFSAQKAATRLQVFLPVGFTRLAALAQYPIPFFIDPGFQVEKHVLIRRLEEVGETALSLQPGDERQFVMRTVGEVILAILDFKQRPVTSIDGFPGEIDALSAIRAPTARAGREDVQERGASDGQGFRGFAYKIARIVRRSLGDVG